MKQMKRLVVGMLALAMLFTLAACQKDDASKPTKPSEQQVSTQPVEEKNPTVATQPGNDGDPNTPSPYNPEGTPEIPVGTESDEKLDVPNYVTLEGSAAVELGNGLRVVSFGSYSGKYVEDGTDDEVENVLAMIVHNDTNQIVEYMEISAAVGDETAAFKLTAVPANSYLLVMESQRMLVTGDAVVSNPTVQQLAWADNVVMDYSSDFEVYLANGVINIINRSGRDFENDVFVCYKTFENNIYMGGITYRARFEGLPDGEIGQSIQSHVTGDHSVVFYMMYDE